MEAPPAPPIGPAYHIANAVRIDAAQAPVIDGDLSDPAWAMAELIDQFYQNTPDAFAPPTERTEVRIMYDENNLYVGVYNYDSAPGDILIGSMLRDGQFFNADNVRISLDPGATRRNGYAFQVSSSGGRRDMYIQNNNDMLLEWNTIWDAKVQLVADGWIVEYAIPFRSLSYDPDQTEWGFDFSRSIRHKNESIRWSSYNPAITDRDLTAAGTLQGINNVSQGLGLDVYVYGSGRVDRSWQGNNATNVTGTGGATVYYRVTPALTATLTNNPDFSDSPLDNRQVNTSRFSLFFPETRDFFLRDAGAFEFGGNNFSDNENNGRPFVSRSIGLVDGAPVTINLGGKLSGQYAGFDIGAVSAWTGDAPASPGQHLTTVRLARPVLEQSQVGVIFTDGDPTGANENTLAGADVQYRTNMFAGKIFQWDTYYERTFSGTEPEDDSFGTVISFPNEPWAGRFQFKQVGTDFRPRLGFANRRGIREYKGDIEHRTRFVGRYLQEMALNANADFFADLNNGLESSEVQTFAFFESRTNDNIFLRVTNYYESLSEPFDLPRDVPIPVGTYEWTNIGARFQTSNARPLQMTVNFNCCSFFDGTNLDINSNFNYRASEYFDFRLRYSAQFLDMPAGSVDIHVASIDAAVNFTPDMYLALEAQWDNISEAFAFSGRYRWEYTPGNEIFAAIGQTATIPGQRFIAESSIFTLRLGRTFQF